MILTKTVNLFEKIIYISENSLCLNIFYFAIKISTVQVTFFFISHLKSK